MDGYLAAIIAWARSMKFKELSAEHSGLPACCLANARIRARAQAPGLPSRRRLIHVFCDSLLGLLKQIHSGLLYLYMPNAELEISIFRACQSHLTSLPGFDLAWQGTIKQVAPLIPLDSEHPNLQCLSRLLISRLTCACAWASSPMHKLSSFQLVPQNASSDDCFKPVSPNRH